MSELKVNSILSRQIVPLLLVSIGLPLLVLAGVGLYFVFQQGYLLWFLVVLAIASVVTKLLLIWFHRHDGNFLLQEKMRHDKDFPSQPSHWPNFG